MLMKQLACAAALLWLPVTPMSAQGTSSDVIGRWRSIETSSGGIGTMLEFRNSGVVAFSPGAVVEAPYRVEGGALVLPADTRGGSEQKQSLEWLGENKFRLAPAEVPAGANSRSEEFARVGTQRDANAPLLGEWTAMRKMAGLTVEVRYIFSADKALFLLPFTNQEGQWSQAASDGSINFKVAGRISIEGKCKVQGDVLAVTQSGSTAQFKRY